MEREKVKEGETKRGELMVEKLKRGVLIGKREGNSTPPPTWKLGLIQADGTLISTNSRNTLSARKLGANLWEMEHQFNPRVANMSKNGNIFSHHRLEDDELEEATAKSPSKQQTSRVNLRRQIPASLMQHNARVDKDGQAQQPLSPASHSCSIEMARRRPAISTNGSGKRGDWSPSLKTSTELLKVLNRIWSLEEKHALDMSLVRTLKTERDQSRAQIQQLMQEKKRDEYEIGNLIKQITEYKVARKNEQEQVKDAEEKLENELKSRRRSEKRHHKLATELLEMKSSFSNALREFERERKARTLLEDLCDEFAKAIRGYEQEARFVKHKSREDQIGREGNDRLILHISEAWLDERTQMKLVDASDVPEKQSALDKLCPEIEAFLREKQSGNSVKNNYNSLESIHLNEPSSAPWNGEDDSVGMSNQYSSQFRRGFSLKQGRIEKLNEMKSPRMPRKGDMMQRSKREGKNRKTDADLGDATARYRSLSSCSCIEGSFDPSMFPGPPSPVKKWTSEVSTADCEVSESSSRWPKTLKAKLMEARLESQLSRTRTS